MNIVTVDRLIFPVVLFAFFFSLFYLESFLAQSKIYYNNSLPVELNYLSDVNIFFDNISRDATLISQLESIIEEENSIEQIVNLGNSLGYNLTISEVSRSIAEHTLNPDGNYVCFSFGCWKINC